MRERFTLFEIGGKQIPATLAESVDPKRSALLLWDMENAIAPNAFDYSNILISLKMLAAVARAGFRGHLPDRGVDLLKLLRNI